MTNFAESLDLCRKTMIVWRANLHESSVQLIPFAIGHNASVHNHHSSGDEVLFFYASRTSGLPKFSLGKVVHLPGPAVVFFLDGSGLNYECPNSQRQWRDNSPNAKTSPSLMWKEIHTPEEKLLFLRHNLQLAEQIIQMTHYPEECKESISKSNQEISLRYTSNLHDKLREACAWGENPEDDAANTEADDSFV